MEDGGLKIQEVSKERGRRLGRAPALCSNAPLRSFFPLFSFPFFPSSFSFFFPFLVYGFPEFGPSNRRTPSCLTRFFGQLQIGKAAPIMA